MDVIVINFWVVNSNKHKLTFLLLASRESGEQNEFWMDEFNGTKLHSSQLVHITPYCKLMADDANSFVHFCLFAWLVRFLFIFYNQLNFLVQVGVKLKISGRFTFHAQWLCFTIILKRRFLDKWNLKSIYENVLSK